MSSFDIEHVNWEEVAQDKQFWRGWVCEDSVAHKEWYNLYYKSETSNIYKHVMTNRPEILILSTVPMGEEVALELVYMY